MARKLLDIQEEIENIYENIIADMGDDWDGIIPESFADQLSLLDGEKTHKMEGVIRAIKRDQLLVNGMKAEKKALDARIKTKNSRIESMTNWLVYASEGHKLEYAVGTLKSRKSAVTEADEHLAKLIKDGDITKVPVLVRPFIKTKTELSLIKKDAADYLKVEGHEIEGVSVTSKTNWKVS